MSLPYHVGNGGLRRAGPGRRSLDCRDTGDALSGLFYLMAIAAIGVVVSLAFIREPSHRIRI